MITITTVSLINLVHALIKDLFFCPRFAERSSLLVSHPAAALCRLHAQMRERPGWAAQPEPVLGYTSAV